MNKDQFISVAGVMRCCIQTVLDTDTDKSNNGDVIRCKYCKDGEMILDKNMWRNKKFFKKEE